MKTERLVAVVRELTDALAPGFGPVFAGRALVSHAQAFFGAECTVVRPDGPAGRPHVLAASTGRVRQLELIQARWWEGPGLDALRTDSPVTAADLAAPDCPWPRFASVALRCGLRSVHAVPYRLHGRTLGVFCLYREHAGTLPPDAVRLAEHLVRLAAVGLSQHERAHELSARSRSLQAELDRRVVVEQAVGVLAARWRTTTVHSREQLRAISRTSGRPLHLAAESVVGSVRVSTSDERTG